MNGSEHGHVVVIGAGFAGLSAAWEMVRRGLSVTVCEAEEEVGGLAGSFEVAGTRLEKFYHHWFTSDTHVHDLVRELGREDQVLYRPTRTGMYFAHQFFRLSTPADVLRFTPLSLAGRLRLGLLALRARRVGDWQELEDLTAEEWLIGLGGREVYDVVWRPLLVGKFGPYAKDISAVWFWNKLKLRGGSRGRSGEEVLAY
jgi:protoporphyrinogen oxidase